MLVVYITDSKQTFDQSASFKYINTCFELIYPCITNLGGHQVSLSKYLDGKVQLFMSSPSFVFSGSVRIGRWHRLRIKCQGLVDQ